MMAARQVAHDGERELLLVEDDDALREALARALSGRGFDVRAASTGAGAQRLMAEHAPAYAVVDLKLPDAYGLRLMSSLIASNPRVRVVVLTGYSSIATAVESIKLGATHYLAKPASVDDIVDALRNDAGDDSVPPNGKPLSLRRLEWEYIHRVLEQNGGNVAATARALSIHRRTLQRKIAKRPVRS
jgi:two-component system response regulator RegA